MKKYENDEKLKFDREFEFDQDIKKSLWVSCADLYRVNTLEKEIFKTALKKFGEKIQIFRRDLFSRIFELISAKKLNFFPDPRNF